MIDFDICMAYGMVWHVGETVFLGIIHTALRLLGIFIHGLKWIWISVLD